MNQISFAALTNFNSAVPWGLWVAIYIWLVGISAGSFLVISLGNLTNNPHLKKISRLGICLSLAALLAGLLSILIDLGHIERFYKLFISPSATSVMAWMVWLYSIYALVLLAALIFIKGLPKLFFGFAFLFALAVIVIESLLFALPPGRSWHSLIFPLHFLTSSLVSAIAALIFVVGVLWAKNERPELLNALGKIALNLIIINFLVEIIEIVFLGGVRHSESLVSILGNIAAIIFLLKRNPASVISAGAIGLISTLFSKYHGLVLTQLIEPFKGFSQAYIEPRIQFIYNPTLFEYLVSIFLVSLVMGLFFVLYKIFPLTREG